MQITSGFLKGRKIIFPKGLEARPTTSFSKEALFNILENKYDWENTSVLDLFAGTGLITLECISRGAKQVTSVDKSMLSIKHIQKNSNYFSIKNIETMRADVFLFLKKTSQKFDIIFADPPYDLPNIFDLKKLVFENNLLQENGVMVIEHPTRLKIKDEDTIDVRTYGQSTFTFYKKIKKES